MFSDHLRQTATAIAMAMLHPPKGDGLMQASFSGAQWHSPDTTRNFSFTPKQVDILQKFCAKRHGDSGGGGVGGHPDSYWADLFANYVDWIVGGGGGGRWERFIHLYRLGTRRRGLTAR